MFKQRLILSLCTLALTANFALLPTQASASSKASSTESSSKASKPKKAKKSKGSKAGGVTFYEGSGETRSERERRLMRECRGRPNSGLCEGFARP